MILRRVREHVTSHNWFAVAVDFVIVVVGVFVGIQASNWNQARLDGQQAREYRAMLRDDLEANLLTLTTRKRYYEWVRRQALAALADLNRPSSSLDEKFLVHAYQATQILPWVLKRNTYDEIQSVGATAKLGPPSLREHVANYYVSSEVTRANMDIITPYRDIMRRIMPYEVQDAIRARCDERVVQKSHGESDVLLPDDDCKLGLDQETVRRSVIQIRDWPGLSLDLNRLLVDVDQKLLSVNRTLDRAAKLKGALEQADS
jgi:hypothetical protein